MSSCSKKTIDDFLSWYRNVRSLGFHSAMDQAQVVKVEKTGRIIYELKLGRDHTNFRGSVHGGLLMTLIDESCVFAVLLVDRGDGGSAQICVTVNANINCISASFPGEVLIIDAIVNKCGSTLSYVTCCVTEKTSNRSIATGNVITFTKTKGSYLAFVDEALTPIMAATKEQQQQQQQQPFIHKNNLNGNDRHVDDDDDNDKDNCLHSSSPHNFVVSGDGNSDGNVHGTNAGATNKIISQS